MKNFQFGKPTSLAQVVSFLAKGKGTTVVISGGTDLLDEIKEGTAAPDTVIDLKSIPGLSYVKKDKDGVAVGALTTIAELIDDPIIKQDYPTLHSAAKVVASPQLRNVGTLGGNLCQRPRCWYYRDIQVPCSKKAAPSALPRTDGISTIRSSAAASAGRSIPPIWLRRSSFLTPR